MSILVLAVLWALGAPAPSVAAPQQSSQEAPAEARPLQAIFLEVDGKVRWRPTERTSWRDAAVNDLLSPGAEVRTGLKSRAALRVGKNATVLVDAGTTFQLPTVVQEGETLRTLAAVKTGRVDFKVDKVGFANDFKVVTPQTTLAVRGTGFGISTGALGGFEITGARTNAINAIELRYVASNLRFFLSGSATSSSTRPEPVQNAWYSTLGPPPIVGLIADPKQLEQAVAQGQTGNNPTNPQQLQQQAAAQSMDSGSGAAVDDLLRLQSQAAGEVGGIASSVGGQVAIADPAATQALSAATAREAAINSVLGARDSLEQSWSGTTGGTQGTGGGTSPPSLTSSARGRLLGWRGQSEFDAGQMESRRDELDLAMTEFSAQDAVGALTAMGAIDDLWSATGSSTPSLKQQAADVVSGLVTLNEALQGALAPADEADRSYNALLADATSKRAVALAIAQPLAQLGQAVESYQQAVAQALGAGNVSPDAARKLQASAVLLQQSRERIASAVSAVDALSSKVSTARSVGERVLLSAAVQATLRGNDIVSEARALHDEILRNVQAIEVARFGGIESAAERLASEGASTLAVAQSLETTTTSVEALATAQQAAIGEVLSVGTNLEVAWSGGGQGGDDGGDRGSLAPRTPSAQAQLTSWKSQSDSDVETMSSHRQDLDAAIVSYSVEDVTTALDAMGSIDDTWQGGSSPESTGLKHQVSAVVQGIVELNGALQGAMSAAQEADTQFNALFSQADGTRGVASSVAGSLSNLQTAVQGYRQSVSQALGSRTLSPQAAQQLTRSVELLQTAQTRIAAAIASVDSIAARLADARGVSQRVLLSAALQAAIRGTDIASEAGDLQAAIQANVQAIEAARFGAFYAAAAAGVAAIGAPETGLVPQVASDAGLAQERANESRFAADEAEADINQVVSLAAEMDAFWNTSQPGITAARIRMEQMRDLSVQDRTAMASMLQQLQGAIASEDRQQAGAFLSDMFMLDLKWNGMSVGLLAEAERIHTQMSNRMAAIDAAHGVAGTSRQNFESLLASAGAQRTAAQDGQARIEAIKAQLDLYQSQYEALAAAGRGGSGAAEQLAQTRASIESLLQGIQAANAASAEAAAAVESATTYGQRVLFSAAANAHAQSAARLAQSAALRDTIRSNAEAIHQDYVAGKNAYDGAFPGGGGT